MKFHLWPRHRPAAAVGTPSFATMEIPQPALAEPQDRFSNSASNGCTETLDAKPQPLKPLTPLKPLASRPRATIQAVDIASATEKYDSCYNFYFASRGYEKLSERFPREPTLALKRMMVATRLHASVARDKAQKDFATIANSPYDRVVAWCSLYADRERGSSHRAFNLSLKEIFVNSKAESLQPAERLLLLRDQSIRGQTLITRALMEGSGTDLVTVLAFSEPCRDQLMDNRHDLLEVALAKGASSDIAALLQYGARPRVEASWERIVAVAIEASSPTLLRVALDCGLDPDRLCEFNGAPCSIAQLIARKRDGIDKLAVLVRAGGSLTRTPKGTRLPSVFRNQAQLGPRTIRELVEIGLPINGFDDASQNTPLMDLAQDGNMEGIEPLLRLGADLNLRRADGKTALDLARAGAHMASVTRIEQYAAIAPYMANFIGVEASTLDALATALYDVPVEDLPKLHALARKQFADLTGPAETNAELIAALSYAWLNLQSLSDEVRERVLLRLRTNKTYENATKVMKSFNLLPAQKWEALLDHQPWYTPRAHEFNVCVMVTTAMMYRDRGEAALEAFDLASYAEARVVRPAQMGQILHQFALAADAGYVSLRVADFAKRQLWASHFLDNLRERVNTLRSEERYLLNPKIPDLPARKVFFTLENAHEPPVKPTASAPMSKGSMLDPSPKTAAKKEVTLHPALEAAMGHCPSVKVDALGNLGCIEVEEIDTLISALQDPDVEDDIIDIPESADATLRLIESVLGACVLDAIYADPKQPKLKSTRTFFLACHPDKASEELKPIALAMTQLLNTIRALLSNEARGPHLSAAYARIRK